MQSERRLVRQAVSGLLVLLAACGSPQPSTGQSSQAVISDQVHGGGKVGFWWLPPLVPQPSLEGSFDATKLDATVVTVTDLASGAEVGRFTSTSSTSGNTSEQLRVDPTGETYLFNWHTGSYNLDPTGQYRISVLIGGNLTGFLDVQVVTSQKQAKNVDTSEYIALLDDGTLPVKWWLNACGSVFCSALDPCHGVGTCDWRTGACSNPLQPDGTACVDGNPCVTTSCVAGACTATGTVACSGSGATSSGTVDASGGTIAAGGTTLAIPANVLASPTMLTVTASATATAPAGVVAYTPVFEFGPSGLTFPPDTVQVSFTVGNAVTHPTILWSRPDGGYDDLGGTFAGGVISTYVTHFSTGFVAQSQCTGLADGTACSNGPCTLSDRCVAGVCQTGASVSCAPSDSCHLPGTCDNATGQCSNPTAPDGSSCSTGGQAGQCVGGQCAAQQQCAATVTGRVLAPNGRDPVANAIVYVPSGSIAPLPSGTQGGCVDKCQAVATALTSTSTNPDGTFSLPRVPSGGGVPVVIQVGGWRRVFTVPVAPCASTSLGGLALPSSKSQGDLPQMAVVTGSADALECTLRKIGIADSEFSSAGGTGRVHLYTGFASPGATIGGALGEQQLTSQSSLIARYDQILFADQGVSYAPPSSSQQLFASWANAGGHAWLNHDELVWLANNASFPPVANWTPNFGAAPVSATVNANSSFAAGATFQSWLQAMGLSPLGLPQTFHDIGALNPQLTQDWLYAGSLSSPAVEHFTFETPAGSSSTCGRVAFSDYRVYGRGAATNVAFPAECFSGQPMSPTEMSFEYLFFQDDSCSHVVTGGGGGPSVIGVMVNPSNAGIPVGGAVQFVATALYSDGSAQDVTTSATWTSGNAGIATVSLGLARGLAAGTTTIQASVGGVAGIANLTVTAGAPTVTSVIVSPPNASITVGGAVQFVATAFYSDGSAQDVTGSASWSSGNSAVAVISGGLATGVAAGSATIVATLDGISGSASLTVTGGGAATVTSVAVNPANATIAVGGAVQFTATAFYSDGSAQDVTASAVWSSNDSSIATVSGGLVTGLGAGATTIKAGVGGVAALANLTVTAAAPTVTSLSIAPSNPTIAVGGAVQLVATAFYSDGSVQDVTASAQWTSSDATVAVVSSGGTVTGIGAGTASVSAGYAGVNAGTLVTVSAAAPTLTAISITPADPTVAAGSALQFIATGFYSDGSASDVTTQVVWASSDASVAVISNAAGTEGQATAVGAGSATILASLDGLSAATTLTVN